MPVNEKEQIELVVLIAPLLPVFIVRVDFLFLQLLDTIIAPVETANVAFEALFRGTILQPTSRSSSACTSIPFPGYLRNAKIYAPVVRSVWHDSFLLRLFDFELSRFDKIILCHLDSH